ncbi:MAG TPA: hypothetical protein VEH62_09420 [Gemmatimonadales bacterium]|nr:hypothetical protein [Gemmatimonadales bacterium]
MGVLTSRPPRASRPSRTSAALAAALLLAAAPLALRGQMPPRAFLRVGAGALNPDDPFYTTLAYGAAAGVGTPVGAFALQVVRQSRDRNEGQDLNNARTFVMLDWEPALRIRTIQDGQAFLRFGAGWLFRSPFRSSPAVDLGAGWRYSLAPGLSLVGSLVDQLAFLPSETLPVNCGAGTCTQLGYRGEVQHNFGLLIDLELHP